MVSASEVGLSRLHARHSPIKRWQGWEASEAKTCLCRTKFCISRFGQKMPHWSMKPSAKLEAKRRMRLLGRAFFWCRIACVRGDCTIACPSTRLFSFDLAFVYCPRYDAQNSRLACDLSMSLLRLSNRAHPPIPCLSAHLLHWTARVDLGI